MNVLRKKHARKYEFILKGGKSLHNALYTLYESVWNEEVKPESWKETTIIQLDKGKPDKADLSNKRYIHTKDSIPKFFSHMLTATIKPKIVENMLSHQIGAVPGHRAQEHLFVIKSFMAHKEKNNEATAAALLDLVKFFDLEHLVNAMNELYESDVEGKLYRLEYEMNEKTRIRVKTGIKVK